MESNEYGWIGKTNSNMLSARRTGTRTAGYFLHYFKQKGAIPYAGNEIRSKNLVQKNGIPYYILSIGVGEAAWAPYLFIGKLDKFHFILTQDTEELQGTLWDVKVTETKVTDDRREIILKTENGNQVNLRKQERKDAGDYYRLSIGQVEILMGYDGKTVEFSLDNMEKIINELLEEGN